MLRFSTSLFFALLLGFPCIAADLNAPFGALTFAGQGAAETGGSSIVDGDAEGHWQLSGGRLTPSDRGDSADLSRAPYRLRLDNGNTVTVTVTPDTYSVASETELLGVIRLGGDLSGRSVELREIGRPYLMTDMWGTMHEFTREVVFRSADPGNPAAIGEWNFVGPEGPRNITWEDLVFEADVSRQDGEPSYPRPALRLGGGRNITFRRVEFDGNLPEWQRGRYENPPVQFEAVSIDGARDILIENCEFHHFVHGLGMVIGENITIRGNDFRALWGDPINISPGGDGNDTRNIVVSDNVVRDFIGNYNSYRHPDFIQIFPKGNLVNPGDIVGLTVERNFVFMGTETPGRGQGQGVLIQEGRQGQWPGGELRDFVARGNVFFLDSIHGISSTSGIPLLVNPLISGNTILPDNRASKPRAEYPTIRVQSRGGAIIGNVVSNPISAGASTAQAQNLVAQIDVRDMRTYQTMYNALNFSPRTLAEALQAVTVRGGGPLDTDRSGGPSGGDIGAVYVRNGPSWQWLGAMRP